VVADPKTALGEQPDTRAGSLIVADGERISLPLAGRGFGRIAEIEPGRWVAPLMTAGLVCSLLSIFLSGVAFAAGLGCWFWDCLRRRKLILEFPPFSFLLFLFLAWVVVAILFSPDFLASLKFLKKYLKFFAVFLVFTYFDREDVERACLALFVVGGGSGLWGLLQYFWLKDVHLMNRIDGFMSHWMTFSGQMMILGVALTAYLLIRTPVRPPGRAGLLIYPALPVMLASVLLTFTRSAWLGLVGGLVVLLAFLRFRWALAGFLLTVLLLLFLPPQFKSRLYSSFDPTDTTTRGRLELVETGLRLIETSPWTGVGPRLVQMTALEARGDEFPDEVYQHLHNNLLQISAELGIPAALLWMALFLKLAFDFIRFRRSRDTLLRFLAVGGLGILAAIQLMGLFEYNFGDSEIVILLLFVISAPYAVYRRGEGRGVPPPAT
jgi:putative inorganic carbon (hco3(-)) transporter